MHNRNLSRSRGRGPNELIVFGAALQEARTGKLSQRELAGLINRSQQTVATWEAGKHEPLPKDVFHMEALLSLNPGQLSKLLGYRPVGRVRAG